MTVVPKSYDADVAVVGAGPCGAFLANLLGQMGLSCVLLEKRVDAPSLSMAIGVMPPSLQRFSHISVAGSMLQAGCPVTRASILSERVLLGTLDLSSLPPPFNYVLSIPQSLLVRILRDKLHAWPNVRLLPGKEVRSVTQSDTGVKIEVCDAVTNTAAALFVRYAVGCEGKGSPTRVGAGISFQGRAYANTFMMGDFPESTAWAGEARLFFTPNGSIESFPLPQARRRWVIQTDSATADASAIERRVRDVTGIEIESGRAEWVSVFTPERFVCSKYSNGRVILCGDAAHVMSPIGGQGMNTGLADAWYLAFILGKLCSTGEQPGRLLARYDYCRRRAFDIAAERAARGMWLGTRKGRLASAMRNVFIRDILFGTSLRHHLAPYFAMLTIPDIDPLC